MEQLTKILTGSFTSNGLITALSWWVSYAGPQAGSQRICFAARSTAQLLPLSPDCCWPAWRGTDRR